MPFSNLNQPQLDAVTTTDGPLLVLAGAGTGKTKVLTSRIINIVNSGLASPLQILAVTFTNKAAAEMKHRIGAVVGEQVNNIWVGTFHAIAARILRRHPEIVGLKSDFTIIDDDDQKRLLKQILGDLNIDAKQFPQKNYLQKISRFKDKMVFPDDSRIQNDDMFAPKLKEVYRIYQERLKSMNAADFGDLLLYNLEIFNKSPDILSYYQNKFRYILVDEYQDTNGAQYNWLLALATIHQNICCVGDDDQSIYSWRGADIANILRFEKDFCNAKVVRLEQNYRSTANILKAADSVISNNKERHGKTLWTDKGEGERVKLLSFSDDRMESATIAGLIKNNRHKYKLSQIAILVRAGYQTRSFEEAFIQNSLPYRVIGGMKFYERLEIRDAIAYLRICANTNDDLALSRIINVPKRGAGDTAISGLYAKSKADNISLFVTIKNSLDQNLIKGKAKESLKVFVDQIDKFNARIGEANLAEIAKEILNNFGYVAMWRAENTLEAQGRIENIEEFINSLADFSNITEFLEYVSLVEARDEKNSAEDSVNIMTVHAAKGLEFDLVFLPGLEDGIFPSAKTVENKNGLEEERRLMYVAITRAKQELILSYAKSRYVFGDYQMQIPSRFLKELPQHHINFEEVNFGAEYGFSRTQSISKKVEVVTNTSSNSVVGKRIFHQKFGYGKVLSEDGKKLDIQFEKSGRKTLMKDFVSLA